MTAVAVTRTVLLRATRDALWPLLSDTQRVNRAMGLSAMTVGPHEVREGVPPRVMGSTSVLGVPSRFEQLPFEWAHGEHLSVLRVAEGGPLASVRAEMRLAADAAGGGGTSLTYSVTVVPRSALASPLAWAFAHLTVRRFLRVARAIDRSVGSADASPLDLAASSADRERLAEGIRRLEAAGVAGPLAARLSARIDGAPDHQLTKIRPFEVARDWDSDPLDTLRAFLHAVPAGLVSLRWSIICPSCRASTEDVPSLADLPDGGHCAMCQLTFDVDLARSVEATFSAHPAVRPVEASTFCFGGPSMTPHVLSQVLLEKDEAKPLPAPGAPGQFRLFMRGGATADVVVAESEPVEAVIEFVGGALSPASVRVAPGGRVVLSNRGADTRHGKLETIAYQEGAATAQVVSTLTEFRRLFSTELVKPGKPLKVARTAVLFSDLTGSTALYARVGDAEAFRFVDDHFDVLRRVIDRHGGTVVKTMGDAIMAAFDSAEVCARAAVDVLVAFEEFRKTDPRGELVGLKVGLHDGPCYVVTANGALDYFGQTVNVASRVQHLAGTGELVLEERTFSAFGAELRARVVVAERFVATVKGVDAPLSLVRLTVSS